MGVCVSRTFPSVLLAAWLCVASAQADRDDTSAASAEEPSSDDTEELEVARRRFARGLELAQRGDFRAAAERFRQALAIREAPAVRFNLASALYETGEHVESFNQLIQVLSAEALDPEVRRRAEVLVERLNEHVATLSVTVGGERELRVKVDDQALPPARMGKRFAVEPGTHRVEAFREGEPVSRRELEVEAGTRALVDMRVVATPAEAAAAAPGVASTAGPVAERPDEAPRRFGVRDWRLWAVVGGSLVALAAAGVAVGLTRDSSPSAVSGDFNPAVLSWK